MKKINQKISGDIEVSQETAAVCIKLTKKMPKQVKKEVVKGNGAASITTTIPSKHFLAKAGVTAIKESHIPGYRSRFIFTIKK